MEQKQKVHKLSNLEGIVSEMNYNVHGSTCIPSKIHEDQQKVELNYFEPKEKEIYPSILYSRMITNVCVCGVVGGRVPAMHRMLH